jgi:hypothetical protein
VRSAVVLPTVSASETMNAVIYMESVITRHVVMQSVHTDRRFATAARFGAMTEADVGSPLACRIGCRKPSTQFLMKPMRYAATMRLLRIQSFACTPLCWPLNWNVPDRLALTLKGLLSFACGRKRHDNRSRDRGPNRRPRMQGIRRSLAQCGRRSGET